MLGRPLRSPQTFLSSTKKGDTNMVANDLLVVEAKIGRR